MDYDISGNIQKLFDEDGLQDILLSVEEYLDNMDLYVFKNWISGEIVEGPVVSKYWVEITLKYDMDKMPDPRGAYLFHNQGTKVQIRRDSQLVARDVREPGDMDPETGKQRMDEVPVLLVKFSIPRRLVDAASVEEYVILDSEEAATESAEPAPMSETEVPEGDEPDMEEMDEEQM